MKISDFSRTDFLKTITKHGLSIKTGPFVVNLRSPIKSLQENFYRLYSKYTIAAPSDFVDFRIRIAPPKNIRAIWRRQACFFLDERVPFKPLPYTQAFPMLEWGMNWCISNHAHQYLIIHAAVVEKKGKGILMPAPPGSGKSTLCAALVSRGWRLLSDELAMFSTETGQLVPLARPINLKNASIDVMQAFAPDAIFSDRILDTNKGTVSLMAAPESSVAYADKHVELKYVIFPRFVAESVINTEEINTAQAFMQVVDNAFNYSVLGLQGFELLSDVMTDCECFSLEYGDLETMIAFFDRLASD